MTASASAGIHDEHPGPDDVVQREAGLVEGALDDREHRPRLAGGVAGWREAPSGPASVVPLTKHASPTAIARE